MNIEIGAPRSCDREALRTLWREAFGDTDEFLDLFERTAYSPTRARALYCDGALSAALYWLDGTCEGAPIAYLYAIATAEAQRGRGLCRRMMEETHAHLRSMGYAAAMLVPSEPSLFGFYERLGYRRATRVSEFTCRSADETIELTRIGADEYAARRRELLPKGSVLQEKESLCYLAAQAELYAADGILLAMRREGDRMVGIELLGDRDAAPRIVRAFGMEQGSFRTVGEDRDFSMILPLNEQKCPDPTYFGLAFD